MNMHTFEYSNRKWYTAYAKSNHEVGLGLTTYTSSTLEREGERQRETEREREAERELWDARMRGFCAPAEG